MLAIELQAPFLCRRFLCNTGFRPCLDVAWSNVLVAGATKWRQRCRAQVSSRESALWRDPLAAGAVSPKRHVNQGVNTIRDRGSSYSDDEQRRKQSRAAREGGVPRERAGHRLASSDETSPWTGTIAPPRRARRMMPRRAMQPPSCFGSTPSSSRASASSTASGLASSRSASKSLPEGWCGGGETRHQAFSPSPHDTFDATMHSYRTAFSRMA